MDGSTDPYYDAMSVMTKYDVTAFETNNKKLDSTLYLDKYGYIMKAVSGVVTNKVDDNLIAVTNQYKTLVDGKIVEMVSGMLSDGSYVDWAITGTSVTALNSASLNKGLICYWTDTNNDNVYDLTVITASVANASISNAKSFVADKITAGLSFRANDVFGKGSGADRYYSDNVRFIFVDNTEGVAKAEGRQSYTLPTNASGIVLAQSYNAKGDITAVFVGAKTDVVETGEIIYVHSPYQEWDEIKDLDDGKQVKLWGYTAYDSNGDPIEPFLGVDRDMYNQFFKKDVNEHGAQKKTRPDVILNHTMLKAEVLDANGTSGDAFTVQDVYKPDTGTNANYGDQLSFISRNTKVVDLSGDGYNIDSVSEINALANGKSDGTNKKTVTVALIYDQTESLDKNGEKIKMAKTVFVLDVKDGKANPINPMAGQSVTVDELEEGDDRTVGGATLNVEGNVGSDINVAGAGGKDGNLNIEGNLTGNVSAGADSNVEISGEVSGSVTAGNNSDVTIGSLAEDGVVNAATGSTVTVTGEVNGTITAEKGATIVVDPTKQNAPVEITKVGTDAAPADLATVKNDIVAMLPEGGRVDLTGTGNKINNSDVFNPTWGMLNFVIPEGNKALVFDVLNASGDLIARTGDSTANANDVLFVGLTTKPLNAGCFDYVDSTKTGSLTGSNPYSLKPGTYTYKVYAGTVAGMTMDPTPAAGTVTGTVIMTGTFTVTAE